MKTFNLFKKKEQTENWKYFIINRIKLKSETIICEANIILLFLFSVRNINTYSVLTHTEDVELFLLRGNNRRPQF